MRRSKQVKQLLYQQELFLARFDVRESFLKNFTREIYENIGQVLSLVKLQLSSPHLLKEMNAKEKVLQSSDLLGQAIKDLRVLSRGFYTDALTEYGLINALQHEVELLEKNRHKVTFTITGTIKEIPVEKELILFSVIKEIFTRVSLTPETSLKEVAVTFRKQVLIFLVVYEGASIKWEAENQKKPAAEEIKTLNIFDKAAFADALICIQEKSPLETMIKLTVSTT